MGEAGGEGPEHRHLLGAHDPLLGVLQLVICRAHLLVEPGIVQGDRGLSGESFRHVHLLPGPLARPRARDHEQAERPIVGRQGCDHSGSCSPAAGQFAIDPRILFPVVDREDPALIENANMEPRACGHEVEGLAFYELGVRQAREVPHTERARVRAQEHRHPVSPQDLQRGVPDGRQDGRGIQGPADGFVDGGQRAGLPVPAPLGLPVPGPLHGEPDLVAQRLEEAQLLIGELLPWSRGDVEHALGRPFELQGDAGVGHGGLQTRNDVRHARALGRVAGLHAVASPEHFRAEALAQALSAHLLEIGG